MHAGQAGHMPAHSGTTQFSPGMLRTGKPIHAVQVGSAALKQTCILDVAPLHLLTLCVALQLPAWSRSMGAGRKPGSEAPPRDEAAARALSGDEARAAAGGQQEGWQGRREPQRPSHVGSCSSNPGPRATS